jgi:hypothetical protein
LELFPFYTFNDNDNERSTLTISNEKEDSKHPYLYLGLDNKIEKAPTIIYFSIIENMFYQHIESKLDFFYSSETLEKWKRLDAIDGTRYLQKKGYIKLFLPSDFKSSFLFGRNLYWIKIVDPLGIFHESNDRNGTTEIKYPYLNGIYINTVECRNASKIENELLTRESDTEFIFSKKPLSLGLNEKENKEKIWVREETRLINSNQNNGNSNLKSVDNLHLVKDSNGNIIERWVLWEERSDFLVSKSNDRHYIIDRKDGKIFFGNGINGKAIPTQDDNLKATYTVGGGKQGNISIGEIKALKTPIPFIDSVINTESGEGGSDMQTAQNGKDEWPNLIKNGGQAVTAEDFEDIIKNKFVSLSKVKCFATTNKKGKSSPGEVLIVVLPESFDKSGSLISRPFPSIELLDNIKDYLLNLSSNILISENKLHISGPLYFKVTVSAEIFVKKLDDIPLVAKSVLEEIKNFLHPIKGGLDGYGWEFGKSLCLSDLYMLFSKIEGIEYTKNISIDIKFDEEYFNQNISLGENEKLVEDEFKDTLTSTFTETNKSYNPDFRLPPHGLLYSSDSHNLQVKYDNAVIEERKEV